MSHGIWRLIRRPFRYPSCSSCVWEQFDCNQAGCLKCGARHFCAMNTVDNTCPLEMLEDRSLVCTITGQVIPSIRHAPVEFVDTACVVEKAQQTLDVDALVNGVVSGILLSEKASAYRASENEKQIERLSSALYKALKQEKVCNTGVMPIFPCVISMVLCSEKNIRFVMKPSEFLVSQCVRNIVICIIDLKSKGVKVHSASRVQSLACGLLYLLRNGIRFNKHTILTKIEEIAVCLPYENKLEAHFGFSSKIICETENEIKLAFREFFASGQM